MPSADELVCVEQHPIFAFHAFAHVEHRLVLHAFAPRIEVIMDQRSAAGNVADGQQLLEALLDLFAAGQRIEHAARVGEFFADPSLGLWTLGVFEPAIVVDDLMTVQRLLDRSDLCLGWRGGSGRAVILRPNRCDGACERAGYTKKKNIESKARPPAISTSPAYRHRGTALG